MAIRTIFETDLFFHLFFLTQLLLILTFHKSLFTSSLQKHKMARAAVVHLQQQYNLSEDFVKRLENVCLSGSGSDSSREMASEEDEDSFEQQLLERREISNNRETAELKARLNATEQELKLMSSNCAVLKNEIQNATIQKQHFEERYKEMSQMAGETAARIERVSQEDEKFRNNIKTSIHNRLFIGAEVAASLLTKPTEMLDLIEYIQLKVHQAMVTEYSFREEKTSNVDILTRDLQFARAEASRLQGLQEDSSTLLERMKEDHSRKISRLTDSIQRLEVELEEATQSIHDNKAKVRLAAKQQDDLNTRTMQVQELETERIQLAKRIEILSEDVKVSRTDIEQDKYNSKANGMKAECLISENTILNKRCCSLEQEKTDLTTQCKSLQQQLTNSLDKYSADILLIRSQHDEKLSTELSRAQSQASIEIQRIREHTTAITERESHQLKTDKDICNQELKASRMRVADLDSDIRQLRIEHKGVEESLRLNISTVQSELKIKLLENQQLSILKEQHEGTIHELNIEAECSNKKLDTLKAEFYEQKMAHNSRTCELEGQVLSIKERLTIYDELETECDTAIEMAGEQHGDLGPNRAADILGTVPSAAGRRVQHSLVLAQKALRLQNELASVEKKLRQKSDEHSKTTSELNRVKGIVGTQGQPYQYFVDTLALKDAEISELKHDLTSAESNNNFDRKDVNALSNENDVLRNRLEQLTSDMGLLYEQRTELSNYIQTNLSHNRQSSKGRRSTRTTAEFSEQNLERVHSISSSRRPKDTKRRSTVSIAPKISIESAVPLFPPHQHPPAPLTSLVTDLSAGSILTQPIVISA